MSDKPSEPEHWEHFEGDPECYQQEYVDEMYAHLLRWRGYALSLKPPTMTNTPNDGGPAFPGKHTNLFFNPTKPDEDPTAVHGYHAGMSLREYYAGLAMQGGMQALIALSASEQISEREYQDGTMRLVDLSFGVADAMLAKLRGGEE